MDDYLVKLNSALFSVRKALNSILLWFLSFKTDGKPSSLLKNRIETFRRFDSAT